MKKTLIVLVVLLIPFTSHANIRKIIPWFGSKGERVIAETVEKIAQGAMKEVPAAGHTLPYTIHIESNPSASLMDALKGYVDVVQNIVLHDFAQEFKDGMVQRANVPDWTEIAAHEAAILDMCGGMCAYFPESKKGLIHGVVPVDELINALPQVFKGHDGSVSGDCEITLQSIQSLKKEIPDLTNIQLTLEDSFMQNYSNVKPGEFIVMARNAKGEVHPYVYIVYEKWMTDAVSTFNKAWAELENQVSNPGKFVLKRTTLNESLVDLLKIFNRAQDVTKSLQEIPAEMRDVWEALSSVTKYLFVTQVSGGMGTLILPELGGKERKSLDHLTQEVFLTREPAFSPGATRAGQEISEASGTTRHSVLREEDFCEDARDYLTRNAPGFLGSNPMIQAANNPDSYLWKPRQISFLNADKYQEYTILLKRLRSFMLSQQNFLKNDPKVNELQDRIREAEKLQRDMESFMEDVKVYIGNSSLYPFPDALRTIKDIVTFYKKPLLIDKESLRK
ncbi:MAG: hypothetical protein J5601_02300 [Elusimicrobiaceae bacterium]|nr:hypothetical protein [Elusimicrobiaceae bacterium]